MMYDNPLFQAVLDHPDDDATRLVLADSLEEQGEPRAEFIRVQVTIAAHKREGRKVDSELSQREAELLRAFGQQWSRQLHHQLAALAGVSPRIASKWVARTLYYRGFSSWLATDPKTLAAQGDDLMRVSPWQYVRMDHSNEDLEPLAHWSGLSKLRTLTIMGFGSGLESLLRSEYLNQLQKLMIHTVGRRSSDESLGRLVSRLRDDGCLQGLVEFRLG